MRQPSRPDSTVRFCSGGAVGAFATGSLPLNHCHVTTDRMMGIIRSKISKAKPMSTCSVSVFSKSFNTCSPTTIAAAPQAQRITILPTCHVLTFIAFRAFCVLALYRESRAHFDLGLERACVESHCDFA